MPTQREKMAFSERLKFALNRSAEKVVGATTLAMQFNLRYRGDRPISPQTAHKWLSGRTIPTQDKLETLAKWLKVDLHWLHYGPSPSESMDLTSSLLKDNSYALAQETIALANKIEKLSSHHKYLVQELVEQFYIDKAKN